MELRERARYHAALSDPVRLKIVDFLKEQGATCGKELPAALGISVALVSHHTKILEEAGIIIRHREGQFSRFTLAPDPAGNGSTPLY